MRFRFPWSHAYSLTLRFGLPGNRARRSETAAPVGERRLFRRERVIKTPTGCCPRSIGRAGGRRAAVEDLEFGFAAGPDAIARLVERADSVAVLHEADRMLPQAVE